MEVILLRGCDIKRVNGCSGNACSLCRHTTPERPFVVKGQIERTSGERVFLLRRGVDGTVTNICTATEATHA